MSCPGQPNSTIRLHVHTQANYPNRTQCLQTAHIYLMIIRTFPAIMTDFTIFYRNQPAKIWSKRKPSDALQNQSKNE